jgi:hypothetical protein
MSDILEIVSNLAVWFKNNDYVGYDPYQLIGSKVWPFLKSSTSLNAKKCKIWQYPVENIFNLTIHTQKKILVPKSLALIIRSNVSLYKISKDQSLLDLNNQLIQRLIKTKYSDYKNYAWGVPFSWKSGLGQIYPPEYPALIVTAEIGHAILDQYEVQPSKELLIICESIASALIDEIGYTHIDNNKLCFHYTALDKYFVTNTNSYAGSFLVRLASVVSNYNYTKIAESSLLFTMDEQNSDGSWYYYAKPFSHKNKYIDSRHTGFTLVSLLWANRILKNNRINDAIIKGWKYYLNNLIVQEIPKSSPTSFFPIDIHDISQLIITSAEMGDMKLSEDCIRWSIANMSNKINKFYFRIFKNGIIIKIPFIRWNQAWMYRALTLFMERSYEKRL